MKKALGWILCLLLVVGSLGGCGSDKGGEEGSAQSAAGSGQEADSGQDAPGTSRVNLADLQVEDYVTLGEYKGITVAAVPAAVEPEQLQEAMLQEYRYQVTAENGGILDRAVQTGDTVILDYVGKKDGVAFDGGTAQGASLTIGSHQYIDGFEEGLVGVMPGETVDLNLTFPESYGNADLAGAPVVFTVTVDYILPEEIVDEVIAGFGLEEYSNRQEMETYVNDYLMEEAEEERQTEIGNKILDTVMNNCSFQEFPQALVDQHAANVRENIAMQAGMYGLDAETFVQLLYEGMSLDQVVAASADNSVKQMMAFWSIAQKEGLVATEEDLDARIGEYASQYNATAEEMLAEIDREEFREYFVLTDVMDFLLENALVTEE